MQKSSIAILLMSICLFAQIEASVITDCQSSFQPHQNCFDAIYTAQTANTDNSAVNVPGIAQEIYACYDSAGCTSPISWQSAWATGFQCWNNFSAVAHPQTPICASNYLATFGVSSDDQAAVAAIVGILNPVAWRPVNFIKGWLGGGERLRLMDRSTIEASCDTNDKRDAVRTCIATSRSNAEPRFNAYSAAIQACYNNASTILGSCYGLYNSLINLMCSCSNDIRQNQAESIYSATSACDGVTYGSAAVLKSIAFGTIATCQPIQVAQLQNFNRWWVTGYQEEF